jgi:hypothetical protein
MGSLGKLAVPQCTVPLTLTVPISFGYINEFPADGSIFDQFKQWMGRSSPKPGWTDQGVHDQQFDHFGRNGGALRQVAHFASDDRETVPLLAGARRLDRRVERQDVGLECDAVDDANEVHDARCRLLIASMVAHTRNLGAATEYTNTKID